MSVEENKAELRRFVEEVWNKGNLNVIDEHLAPDFVIHKLPFGLPLNAERLKQLVVTVRSAFPDIHFSVDDLVAEGDKVAIRWTGRRTHKGEIMGIPPTNKQVTWTGIEIHRMVRGKTVVQWPEVDALSLMQQLGVIPAQAQAKK